MFDIVNHSRKTTFRDNFNSVHSNNPAEYNRTFYQLFQGLLYEFHEGQSHRYVGTYNLLRQHLKQTPKYLLYQNGGHMAHIQLDHSICGGFDSHLQGTTY